jgi:hypothetical protein
MTGVPGTLKGHIRNAKWGVSEMLKDNDSVDIVITTDSNVNYHWLIPIGPNDPECNLIARLVAEAPKMLDLIMESLAPVEERWRDGDEQLREMQEVVDRINPDSIKIVPLEDLPK